MDLNKLHDEHSGYENKIKIVLLMLLNSNNKTFISTTNNLFAGPFCILVWMLIDVRNTGQGNFVHGAMCKIIGVSLECLVLHLCLKNTE